MELTLTYGYYNEKDQLINVTINVEQSLEYYKELKELLKIKAPIESSLIRVGSKGDGGYVMVNEFNSNIAYSFGVGDNTTWDEGMSQLGYDVYMYDPTVTFEPKNPKLHFFKEGIGEKDSEEFKTLETILHRNKHNSVGMILKMDVEGAEWPFLKSVKEETLNMFDQILFEFHGLLNPTKDFNILSLLKKLNKTHQLVHLHGNNCGMVLNIGGLIIPSAIEVTYLNKKYLTTTCNVSLPNPLDSANDLGREDIFLGNWNEFDIEK